MKRKILLRVLLIFVIGICSSSRPASAGQSDTLLGITWGDSTLVSFDPYAGVITQVHAYLNPAEGFRGVAHAPNRGKLYALSQGSWNLYEIDPLTLNIRHIGKLDINTSASWGEDIGGLSYDPGTDSLYTVASHWGAYYTGIWSELVRINIADAKTTTVGYLSEGFCDSLVFNEDDGQLYGILIQVDDPWSIFFRSVLVAIDPGSAAMTELFELPYRTIMGLAKKPGEKKFYSWVNSEWGHFYGLLDLDAQTATLLGGSDSVDVVSDAMTYKDFDVSSLQEVTDLVSFKISQSASGFTPDTSGCPEYPPFPPYIGKLSFEARLTNKSSEDLSGVLVVADSLPEQTIVLNASGGTGGTGSFLMLPMNGSFSDGILGPKETARIPFVMCVTKRKAVKMAVTVLGVAR
ncbi:MAG: hypothetical protein OEW04_11280 [Nitrospirota bacterium]|nr:hypothetical protein [Nitrospirota bacterium]